MAFARRRWGLLAAVLGAANIGGAGCASDVSLGPPPVTDDHWALRWSTPLAETNSVVAGVTVADPDPGVTPEILVPRAGGFAVFSPEGKRIREVTGIGNPEEIVVGRANGKPVILAYATSDKSLTGRDPEGRTLWTLNDSPGEIVDICSVPLSHGEVGFAVGYRDAGITLISGEGKGIFRGQGAKDVGSIAVARTTGGPRILEFAPTGGVDVLDLKGQSVTRIPEVDGSPLLGAGNLDGSGNDTVFTLGIPSDGALKLRAWSWVGHRLWESPFAIPELAFQAKPLSVGHFLSTGTQIALTDGRAIRCFSAEGQILAETRIDSIFGAALLPRTGAPDELIVRSQGKLSCYRLLPARGNNPP